MSLKKYNCALCNTPVAVPDGVVETNCLKCGNIIRVDEDKSKRRRRLKLRSQAVILVLLLAVMGGVWAYVGTRDSGGSQSAVVSQPVSKWIEYIGGEPRASDVGRDLFGLYEFHADDKVRILALVNVSGDEDEAGYMCGPWLLSYDDLLSADFINCQLLNQSPVEVEYHGNRYYYYDYLIKIHGQPYGYDTLVNQGYLHVRATDRLLSIGSDPYPYCDQDIIAVAIPQSANVTSIFDYQPYRHITLDGWDIYYYDVTDISSHVSIHITYVSGADAPDLNWSEVEAAR